jgi:phosphoribosylformylglycinamidine (FGAM) synthase-like enzyme
VVCDIPVPPLSQDAPNYDRPWNPPKPAPVPDISKYPEPKDYGEVLLKLMSSPDMASKRWIWEQYDRHVMGDTIDSSQSGGDAAIVRIHGTNKALAITSDCNPHYVAADPFEGGKQAVAEAYRNLSAVGATPIAITDNLNFGNPEKPDTMGVIVKAIEGMAAACKELDFPVVSGNVSLYNETDGVGIPPTPVVGGIGLIEDLDKIATLKGAREGDVLLLVREPGLDSSGNIGASLYVRVVLGLDGPGTGSPPPVNLDVEKRNATFVRRLIRDGLVHAVHDVSDGGILCAATEMALAAGVGVTIDPPTLQGASSVALRFGESQARYLLAVDPKLADRIANDLQPVPGTVHWQGEFGGDSVTIVFDDGLEAGKNVSVPLSTLRAAHEGWLPTYMKG